MTTDKHTAVVGVDPGLGGFLTLIVDGPSFHIDFHRMPVVTSERGKGKTRLDVASLASLFREWAATYDVRLVAVEKQGVHPGQGCVSAATIGFGFGALCGICSALGLPLMTPTPQSWQQEMFAGVSGSDPKARSILAAGALFPLVDLRATENCRTPHDGKSDSLLLAAWGLRKLRGSIDA